MTTPAPSQKGGNGPHREDSAVVIELAGAAYSRIVVTTPEAASVAAEIQRQAFRG